MKPLLYGLLSVIGGFGLGIVLASLLLKIFPVEACPAADVSGMLFGYECSGIHPSRWVWYLPFVGWMIGPLLINIIYEKRNKRYLYGMRKALLITLSTGLVFALLIILIFSRISEEIMKII